MKRFYIALLLLAALFSATLYNAHFLNTLTSQLTDLLAQAELAAEAQQWGDAEELTQHANHLWQEHTMYLHILLRHNDTDDVNLGFREVQALILKQDAADYTAANARLMVEIELLYEAEQLSLRNVL
ncbi:MAG: DUF4363 family protein [Pseudoflavonifractor sp.]